MLLIKNGRVLDPATKTDAALDVLLDGDRIAKVGANLSAADADVFVGQGAQPARQRGPVEIARFVEERAYHAWMAR